MCGEKSQLLCAAASCEGSPPRVRGKGKWSYHITKMRGDHPRVCGEKPPSCPEMSTNEGSPPRMRGKVSVHSAFSPFVRITPACAGKSRRLSHCRSQFWDHPRVCGEKRRVRSWRALLLGSPPRMRGKVVLSSENPLCRGITPAYAGKRRSIGRLSQPTRDHPRVCGEKCSSVRSASHRRGSPPRVRGKVCDLTIIRVHHGITPAYAGKRLKRSHSIGHFSCILCLFHSVLHRASVSGGSRAGPRAPPCLPAQNTVPV